MIRKKMQKTDQKDKTSASDFKKMTFKEMREAGKAIDEEKQMAATFYRTQRGGVLAESIGMQSALNNGNFGYLSKNRVENQRQRMNSATISNSSRPSRRSIMISRTSQKKQTALETESDAVSYASRSSAASSLPRRFASVATESNPKRVETQAASLLNDTPVKYKRFNEEKDTRSQVSRAEREAKSKSLMSTQNLAAFTKNRTALKVIGTPSLHATKEVASSVGPKSIFSSHSRMSRKQKDLSDMTSVVSGIGIRGRKEPVAQEQKKRIMDVVNRLNEEDLEKLSEKLKAEELVVGAAEIEVDDNGDINLEDDQEGVLEDLDQVDDLESKATSAMPDDMASSVSRQISTKSQVSVLRQQLEEEKEARKYLESELQKLQEVTSEFAKQLSEKQK